MPPATRTTAPTIRTANAQYMSMGNPAEYVGKSVDLDPNLIGYGQNVRANEITNEEVIDLAQSLKRGQLQNIGVYVNANPTTERPEPFILSFGNRRLTAAKMLRNGDKKLGVKIDDKFSIRATVYAGIPAKAGQTSPALVALTNAWNENNEREETTAIDAAHTYRILRTEHKLDPSACARILGVSKPWLVTLAALEKVDPKIKALVISGDMPAKTAAQTADYKPDAVARVIAAMEKANAAVSASYKAGAEPAAPRTPGKGSAAAIKAGKAAVAAENAANPKAKDARGRKANARFRDVREVRALFAGVTTSKASPAVKAFAQVMVDFCSAGSSVPKVLKALANVETGTVAQVATAQAA